MHVLWVTEINPGPTLGGVERVTVTIAEKLRQIYGIRSFNAYYGMNGRTGCQAFDASCWFDLASAESSITQLVSNWNIDVVIVQFVFDIPPQLHKSVLSKGCKIVVCQHFAPRWELEWRFLDFVGRIVRLTSADTYAALLRQCVLLAAHPLYLALKTATLSTRSAALEKSYMAAYDNSDRVVLLSEAFVPEFQRFAGIETCEKLVAIPNSLSFERFATFQDIDSKRRTVLIVSRFDEHQKRLTLALSIWSKLCKSGRADGWQLRIVGGGDAEKLYRHYVRFHRVPRVTFLGRMDPFEEYQKASLFFMTSRSEGWGITLTEAQQMGVVPLAFDTYASLHDIITDGEDGCIIPEGDIDAYVRAAARLMSDGALRQRMALQAVESSKRFSQDKVAAMWYRLLCEVTEG